MEKNKAIELEKYTHELLQKFNEKHRTNFSHSFSFNSNASCLSDLEKKTGLIRIALPVDSLDGDDMIELEALKVLVGHELAHHVYANMSMTGLQVLAMCMNRAAGDCRDLFMSCSREIAADIHGRNFYTSMGGTMTPEIYEAYYRLILGDQTETRQNIADGLKSGYLPASFRLKLMKHHSNFKANNYSIIDDIAKDLDYLTRKYLNKDYDIEKYLAWIQLQMEMINFPARPNRLR